MNTEYRMSNTEVLGNERSLDPWGNELKVEGKNIGTISIPHQLHHSMFEIQYSTFKRNNEH